MLAGQALLSCLQASSLQLFKHIVCELLFQETFDLAFLGLLQVDSPMEQEPTWHLKLLALPMLTLTL